MYLAVKARGTKGGMGKDCPYRECCKNVSQMRCVDKLQAALKEWFRLEKRRLHSAAAREKKKEEAAAATKNPDDEVCIYSLHTYYLSFRFNIKFI